MSRLGTKDPQEQRKRASSSRNFEGVSMITIAMSKKVSLLAVCLLALAPAGFAQAVYGSLYGTVTDPTGAIIPNATVTVPDISKGTSDTATTKPSRDYTATHL